MSEAADSEFKIAQVPCPFLPEIHKIWRAQDLVDFRNNRGSEFYFATLFAEKLCSPAEFPRDEKQLLEERIAIPRLQEVLKSLASFGWLHEIEAFEKAYSAVEELSDRSLL